MSEQNASTEAANSSQETGTQQETTEQEVDYRKRFEDTQAWGTQNAQEATKYRQEADELRQRDELYRTMLTADDPTARREAAEALGFEFEEDPNELADPNEDLRRRVEAHEQRFEQMTQAQQEQAIFDRDVAHVGESLTALGKELNRSLTKEEVQLLGDAAWQNRDEQGLPNIAAVIEMAKPMLAAQAPQRPRAPHVPGNGQAATHVPNLETRAQIADYIAAEVAALDDE